MHRNCLNNELSFFIKLGSFIKTIIIFLYNLLKVKNKYKQDRCYFYHLACTYLMLEKEKQAIFSLERAIKNGFKDKFLLEINSNFDETPAYWKKIYKINSSFINTPGLIYPGQVFFVPELKTVSIETELAEKSAANIQKPQKSEITTVRPKSVQESAELLNEIPFPEKFEPNKIILSRRIKNKELDDFLPLQLSSEDFDGVDVYAGVELENKKHNDRK